MAAEHKPNAIAARKRSAHGRRMKRSTGPALNPWRLDDLILHTDRERANAVKPRHAISYGHAALPLITIPGADDGLNVGIKMGADKPANAERWQQYNASRSTDCRAYSCHAANIG